VLIPRENIIVFGEDLKLGINLRRTIVIEFNNSGIIQILSSSFTLQVERVFYINLCVLCLLFIFAFHRF
jgi:hypothetical protein